MKPSAVDFPANSKKAWRDFEPDGALILNGSNYGELMKDANRHLMTIFTAALDHEAGAARDAYLDEACGGDAALRERVEGLLRAHEHPGRFLEATAASPRPASDSAESPVRDSLSPAARERGEGAGPRIAAGSTIAGRYKLLEEIGEGGMGAVWMAEQTEPVRRYVAVKLIKPGMDSRQVVARFEAERQALAVMDHPNIAKVLDGGVTGGEPGGVNPGRPFFVMELVKGTPITKYCDENRLPVRERLELFPDVCRAVQHAHQKGIIHRDIKPSNVLVAPYDGKPVVKVIDFGIAKATGQKLTEATLFTGFGAVVGTPEYMSPEQAEVNNQDIDTRSDIYSLGVLLYELLTGTTPLTRKRLKEAALLEVLRLIREEEPPRPSTRLSSTDELPSIAAVRGVEPARLSTLVKGELDWIVMKALEKDRNRRYDTANGLAMDVQRYLADEPVQACPPSAWYRLRKAMRRNKVLLSTGALVVAALLLGTALAAWQAVRATEAHAEAQAELEERKRQYERAEGEYQRAEANFLKTLEAVDQLLTEVGQKELASLPHLEPVRRRLLEKALKFFEEFLGAKRVDARVLFEAGLAYRRVGDIQRLLGDNEQAEKAYGEAIRLLDLLRVEMPEKRAYRQELARAHHGQASLFRELDRWAAAEKASEQAAKLQQELLAAAPADPDYRNDLAKTQNNWGIILQNSGRFGEAEAAFRQGLGLMRDLAARSPDNTDYHRTLVAHFGNLADLLADVGKTKQAEGVYGEMLGVAERGIRAHPKEQERRLTQFWASHAYGSFLQGEARFADAERILSDALKFAQALANDYPNTPAYRLNLVGALGALGIVKEKAGDMEKAKDYLTQSCAMGEKLVGDFPTVADYQSYLGASLNNLASVHHRWQNNRNLDFALVRYNANGSLDSTFGSGGIVAKSLAASEDQAMDVAIVGDKILAAGYALGKQTSGDFALARFNANGTLDQTFGNKGKVLTDFGSGKYESAMRMAVQADGKIVLAGTTQIGTSSSYFAFAVARYNPNGSLDTTFGSGGRVTVNVGEKLDTGTDRYIDLALSGNRIILVGTAFSTDNIYVVQLNGNGQLDPTFGTGGVAQVGRGWHARLAVQADGKAVVSCNRNFDTDYGIFVTRLRTNGATDTSFGMAGTASLPWSVTGSAVSTAVAIDSLDRVLIGGWDTFGVSNGKLLIARFTSSGALDPTFGVGGWNTSGNALNLFTGLNAFVGLTQQPDGKALLVGTAGNQAADWRFAVARFEGDPTLLAASLPEQAIATSIAANQVQPLVSEAIARWQATGADTSSLGRIDIRIADLGGTTLGFAWGNTIWLDDNAAGWGWFIDPMPWDDSESSRPSDQSRIVWTC